MSPFVESPIWHPLPAAWYAEALHTPGCVLLETSATDTDDHESYLFREPKAVLKAETLDGIPGLFGGIDLAMKLGLHVAGWFAYECGYHFQKIRFTAPFGLPSPLACVGIYEEPLKFNHRTGEMTVMDTAAPGLEAGAKRLKLGGETLAVAVEGSGEAELDEPLKLCPVFDMDAATYADKLYEIQRYIENGDTYQVNFTGHVRTSFNGSIDRLHATVAEQQPSRYASIVNLDEKQKMLSFSPELFFEMKDGKITTRPMKGTAKRGEGERQDLRQAEWLLHDEKNRAEHIMIVDLLRNDLGRICQMGSVKTEGLFTIEQYRTLYQMTSTVTGMLREDVSFYEILNSLFPSGSITGAPKHRTMQIIHALEDQPRGVYTGAIGYIRPDKSAAFSIPIRTLVVDGQQLSMGVGSGVVADSVAEDEYAECFLKTSFLKNTSKPFSLIESILWNGMTYPLLHLHLERLEKSATQMGFKYDPLQIKATLVGYAAGLGKTHKKVRLVLHPDGNILLENLPVQPANGALKVRISKARVYSGDTFLQHKTTMRELYTREYAAAVQDGFDEVVFLNERGEVTEGAITNVVMAHGDRLVTPPVRCGLLPGVYRKHLMQFQNIEERVLNIHHILSADAVYLCNAIRGLQKVQVFEIDRR